MSDFTSTQKHATTAAEYEVLAEKLLADIRQIEDKMRQDRAEIDRLREDTRQRATVAAQLAAENRVVLARMKAML